jgi:hypothetical protein
MPWRLQVAEMAWQQGIDAYAASDHALLAALELHARIINAGTDASLLPPGFAFVESLPPPPNGTFWKFDIRSQAWWAHDAGAPEVRSQRLDDGVKYLVGVMWLPTGVCARFLRGVCVCFGLCARAFVCMCASNEMVAEARPRQAAAGCDVWAAALRRLLTVPQRQHCALPKTTPTCTCVHKHIHTHTNRTRTGWELGYNHYAGRLGVPMPETAKLLARHPVEFFTFHCECAGARVAPKAGRAVAVAGQRHRQGVPGQLAGRSHTAATHRTRTHTLATCCRAGGLGTLTHADTAMPLWRAGLARHTVCGGTPAPRASPPE